VADYNIPTALHYTAEDEWVREDDDRVTVGVTDFAQDQLGDVVYVELPEVGARVVRGQPFGVIESVKAVSDLLSPVSGKVVQVNGDLTDEPEKVNEDCYGAGWMLAIEPSDPSDLAALLDAETYAKSIDERGD
jgi:glycine cleavage system H protein